MKSNSKVNINNNGDNHNQTKNGTNGFLPNSLKFISTCIRTASSGVRSASASVAASLSSDSQELKDQVWAQFDFFPQFVILDLEFGVFFIRGFCNLFHLSIGFM